MDDKTKKELLEFLEYERSRNYVQLGFAEKCYERYMNNTTDVDDRELDGATKRMNSLRLARKRFNLFITLLKTELGIEAESWERN